MDGSDQAFRSTGAGDRGHECTHLVFGKAAEQDAIESALAPERRQDLCQRVAILDVDVAIRAYDEDARSRELTRQELEQPERRLVGPVEVVEKEKKRLRRRRSPERRNDRVEELEARLL